MGIWTRLKMIWAILTCKDVSLYALNNSTGISYETTVDENKKACNMACNMCLQAKSRYYKTVCIPDIHCNHYIKY